MRNESEWKSYPVLNAKDYMDYKNVSGLTDDVHRLPDWLLRKLAGAERTHGNKSEAYLRSTAGAYLEKIVLDRTDVSAVWNFLYITHLIGARWVTHEYQSERKADGVEESDQPS